jgi:hypothetical protein
MGTTSAGLIPLQRLLGAGELGPESATVNLGASMRLALAFVVDSHRTPVTCRVAERPRGSRERPDTG